MTAKNNKSNSTQEFLERKKMQNLDLELSKKKHKMKMDELEYLRESNRLFHERELERGRIKTAEIRRSQERQFAHDNPYPYPRD